MSPGSSIQDEIATASREIGLVFLTSDKKLLTERELIKSLIGAGHRELVAKAAIDEAEVSGQLVPEVRQDCIGTMGGHDIYDGREAFAYVPAEGKARRS